MVGLVQHQEVVRVAQLVLNAIFHLEASPGNVAAAELNLLGTINDLGSSRLTTTNFADNVVPG
jgi:hypothetical protein